MHKVRRLTMYLKLFIVFYKLLLSGVREGGQACPDYNVRGLVLAYDWSKSEVTVAFVWLAAFWNRSEVLIPRLDVNVKLD